MQGTCEKIDFLVYPPVNKDRYFYVEATVSGWKSNPNEYSAAKRIIERIQRIPHPYLDISLEKEGTLCKNLSNKDIREIVEKFSDSLNRWSPNDIRRYRPIDLYNDGNWVLRAHYYPCTDSSDTRKIHPPSQTIKDGWKPLLASLERKANKWKNFGFAGHPFIVAVNACGPAFLGSTKSNSADIRRALFNDPDPTKQFAEFRKELRCISGVVVVGNAVLGNEYGAKVQLFRNGNADIPECLHFLFEEQRFEVLLDL